MTVLSSFGTPAASQSGLQAATDDVTQAVAAATAPVSSAATDTTQAAVASGSATASDAATGTAANDDTSVTASISTPTATTDPIGVAVQVPVTSGADAESANPVQSAVQSTVAATVSDASVDTAVPAAGTVSAAAGGAGTDASAVVQAAVPATASSLSPGTSAALPVAGAVSAGVGVAGADTSTTVQAAVAAATSSLAPDTTMALPVTGAVSATTGLAGTDGSATGQGAAGLGISANGLLELSPAGTLNASAGVDFTGADGTLVLDETGTNSLAIGGVAGFAPGDVIDVRGVPGVTAASEGNATLTLSAGGTTALSLPLLGSFYRGALVVSSDGSGGVDVAFSSSASAAGTGSSATAGGGTPGSSPASGGTTVTSGAPTDGGGGTPGNATSGATPGATTGATTGAGLAGSLSTFNSGAGGGTTAAAPTTGTISASTIAAAGTSDAGTTTSANATATIGAAGSTSLLSHGNLVIAAEPNGGFVMQTDMSGQPPTDQTLTGSTVALSDGTGVLDASGNAEQVAHLYQAAFDRGPDLGGLQYWAGQLDTGVMAPVDVANSFAASPEFGMLYGSLSNGAYVDQLYENVLGHAGDAGGEQYWTAQLQAGASRGQVLQGFADSSQNIQNTLGTTGDVNEAEAYRLYATALGRAPDASGLSYWTTVLQGGTTPEQVAQGFVDSPEFGAKYGGLGNSAFVDSLYQNVLGRTPDAAGAQYWTGMLNGGGSRADVVLGFADSTESRLATGQATHANWVFVKSS